MKSDKSDEELELYIVNPLMLALALKKWYTGMDIHVTLCKTSHRTFYIQSHKKNIRHRDKTSEVIGKYRNIQTWGDKELKRDVEKLKLTYPMTLIKK
jgi:hypothetical protein